MAPEYCDDMSVLVGYDDGKTKKKRGSKDLLGENEYLKSLPKLAGGEVNGRPG